MVRNKRLRAVIIAGCALAVVAAVGVGVAFASPSGRARYVTASVGTGDVTQTYTTSGTVTRTNTSTASFAVDGTVSSVQASVGSTVTAGDVLATVKKGPLQLAVLQAETSVAQAKASLYSAQHPSSASTGTSANRTGTSAGKAQGSGSSATKSKASTGVTIDPAVLLTITQRVTTAVGNESKVCAPVFGAAPSPEPSASPSPSGTPSAQPSPSASPSNQPSGSASPSASASVTRSESPTGTASGSPSASVKNQADVIEGNNPTNAQLKACGAARAEVQMATVALQQTVKQLTTQRPGSGSSNGSVGAAVRRPARAAPAPPRRSARPRWPRRRRSCCRPNRTCSRHRTAWTTPSWSRPSRA